ncbi:hypothetical protein DTO271G3_8467 [Paecilomyces variotii]|nr:hypothetical protein DTO271G3_8467 [Paecilomyces variotii]
MSSDELVAQTLFDVKGFVAVVTGGGSGIGLMAAQALAANGARVYVVGRRNEPLQTVAKKYASNGQIIPLPGDIAHTDGVKAIAAELEKNEAKGINILINNAGVSPESRASSEADKVDFSDANAVGKWMVLDGTEAWRESYAGNVAAHHFLTAALLPLLNKGREAIPGHSSSIINITSTAGITKTHSRGQFAYSSSKAAFLHLTQEWAHTFVPLRIRVNSIAPGLFPSEMTTGGSDENQKSHITGAGQHFPAGRTGRETDIGSAVLYLASRAGTYVNGQVVHVDGGLLLKTPSTG